MTKLNLLYIPNTVLYKKAKEVSFVNDEIRNILDNMMDIMYEHNGIGLAGNQVGILKRLVVIDSPIDETNESGDEKSSKYKMINPKILWYSKEKTTRQEGCLSIPIGLADIERPTEITVEYLDEKGKKQSLTTGGLLSTCIQHEIDHLNGILYIDYLSKLKRDIIYKKVKKYLKGQE